MTFSVSAPGRICLFGEHQDYFGLPVVASAINLRTTIRSSSRVDRLVQLNLKDTNERLVWDLDALPAPKPREYLLIALHLAKREGWLPGKGWDAEVSSGIPMRAGASSSSALLVAWCALIAQRKGAYWNQDWAAHAAWRAEVEWFDEPGGKMDQTVCAFGGTQFIEFEPQFKTMALPMPRGSWVLFDTNQPKDTLGVLSRAKHRRLELLEEWKADCSTMVLSVPPQFPAHWNAEEQRLMLATLENKRISAEGASELAQSPMPLMKIGALLQQHHHWLSHGIEVSTPRIDSILKQAQKAGALGGKINGSGGGGTGFVLCQSEVEAEVIDAISMAGGHPIPIALGAEGVRIED
tara:strand:+ start:303 stop:1355 length:1053 start_codon:yes stop_codon:yes gene_type:complete